MSLIQSDSRVPRFRGTLSVYGIMSTMKRSTYLKSASPSKPLTVRIVEFQALFYVVLAVVGASTFLLEFLLFDGSLLSWDSLLILVFWLTSIALPVGMYMAVRQGLYAWFLLPNTVLLFPFVRMCICGTYACVATADICVIVALLVALSVSAVAPIALLSLPASRRWRRGKLVNRKKRGGGCLLCVVSVLLLLLVCGTSVPSNGHRVAVIGSMRGQGLKLLARMCENDYLCGSGGAWVDPSACSNSLQFVQALYAKDANGAKYTNVWSIAVNPPNDDLFPVMITSNMDVAELLNPSNKTKQLSLTCPKEWCGDCFGDCKRFAVIIRKGGGTIVVKKHMTPNTLFCGRIPKPGPNTYFLTPTGRIEFSKCGTPHRTQQEQPTISR